MIRVRRPRGDSGFTLLELMVSMVLFGVIVAIAAGPYQAYDRAQRHLNSTRKIVATFRNAQMRAVAENATYRVTVAANGRSITRQRLNGATWVEPFTVRFDSPVRLRDALFTQPDGGTSSDVYFYPRGTATKGSLVVSRSDKSKTYSVTVEGLTARVSYS